jgi:hypothetical protein
MSRVLMSSRLITTHYEFSPKLLLAIRYERSRRSRCARTARKTNSAQVK